MGDACRLTRDTYATNTAALLLVTQSDPGKLLSKFEMPPLRKALWRKP